MPQRHPHPRLHQRLSRLHEYWVYSTAGLLALSGIGWLICHYLLHPTGPGPHPLEVWWLRAHGAALVGFLIVLGTVMPTHVLYGWRHRMNRGTGVPVLIVASLLAITGYGLYYLVDDSWRSVTSAIHWIVGLIAILLLILHAILGKHGSHAQAHPDRHAARARAPTHHPGHGPPS